MVNGASCERFVTSAVRVGLPVGLHLNLTEGTPISDPELIPSLLDPRSSVPSFRGNEGFREAVRLGEVSLAHIRLEADAQLARFATLFKRALGNSTDMAASPGDMCASSGDAVALATPPKPRTTAAATAAAAKATPPEQSTATPSAIGILPASSVSSEVVSAQPASVARSRDGAFLTFPDCYPKHADGHQHCHVLGSVAAVLAPLFASRGVRSVRLPVLGAEEAATEGFRNLPPRRLGFYRRVAAEAARARAVYCDAGVLAPRAFVGFSCMGSSMMLKDRTVRLLTAAARRVAEATDPGTVGGTGLESGPAAATSTAVLAPQRALPLVELMSHPGRATTPLSVAQTSPRRVGSPGHKASPDGASSESGAPTPERLGEKDLAELAGCGTGPDRFAASIERENEMTGLRGIVRILNAQHVRFQPIA